MNDFCIEVRSIGKTGIGGTLFQAIGQQGLVSATGGSPDEAVANLRTKRPHLWKARVEVIPDPYQPESIQ